MTVKERVLSVVRDGVDLGNGYDKSSIEKMIYLAYYIGREQATREVSDRYNAHIAEQKARAKKSRYYRLALSVVGNEDYLYSTDYSAEMTGTFGSDEADI